MLLTTRTGMRVPVMVAVLPVEGDDGETGE
jgi:hypothetical protein